MHFQINSGLEYAVAHTLGLSGNILRNVTRSATDHSFTNTSRRNQLSKSIG
jgi:hypothetical protein